MSFVKYFMHKVPNKCSPVDAVWPCLPELRRLVWGPVCRPPTCCKERRPRWQHRETLPRWNSYKPTRMLSWRMGVCVGAWVVLWWVSSPHIKKDSVQLQAFGLLCEFAWACVGFLLFPPTGRISCTLGDSKSLLSVSVCVLRWTGPVCFC